ncbi:MAG: exodeoxyribonuclease VII large subunit, partial [Lachnospiraceae bacterium]|nr:exodeoxyribonuclease VII large subunit [Lachnospiraceae bacterium]
DGAVPSIVRGIKMLEEKQVDVMIVGRGGGSIEDLWAFNEEAVAQAVFDCSVPIISAVGHETDTTIIDFVSDLRAPTPSAAAELAVYDVLQVFTRLETAKASLLRQMQGRLRMEKDSLKVLEAKLKMNSPMGRIRERRSMLMSFEDKLTAAMKNKVTNSRHRLAVYIERLKGLSPLDKLNQGYSYVADAQGRTLTDIDRIAIGEMIRVYVKNGMMEASVIRKQSVDREMGDV